MKRANDKQDYKKTSIALELSELERVLEGQVRTLDDVQNQGLFESPKAMLSRVSATLALAATRLRDLRRVIRGEQDAESFWREATDVDPSPTDDPDLVLRTQRPRSQK